MGCAVCFAVDTAVDNLARLRVRRAMAQADLARRAGVSVTTIHKAEIGNRLPHMRNRVLIVEALVRAMPLRDTEIAALARALELDAGRIAQIQEQVLRRSESGTPQTEALHRALDELVSLHGADAVGAALLALSAGLGVRRQTSEVERSLVYRGPPVQRPGFVEHVEVDYGPPAPRPAAAAKPKRKGA